MSSPHNPSQNETDAAPGMAEDAAAEPLPERDAPDDSTKNVLGKLHKLPTPVDLSSTVPDLIHRRSRGRFFGRKPVSERFPLEWLSLLMLLLLAILYGVMKLAPSLLGAPH